MLNRPIFLIALFAGLFCLSPLAIADQTMDECVRITECTSQCESASDTACLDNCGASTDMQTAIADLEACEIAACPGGQPGCGTPDCETQRISVLFVCLGVDAGCIAASQCIDNQCGEEFDVDCVNGCNATHLEGETLVAANSFYGCADENCGDATSEEAQYECVQATCSTEEAAFTSACNFDALDGGSDGGMDSGEDDPDDPACDRFARCIYTCEDPNDWNCLTACTDDLPESPGADTIYDFLVCGQNAGCTGPDDEACMQQNCMGEAIALGDVCGDGDTDDDDDFDGEDENGAGISEACTDFIMCIERCEDWVCTERCAEFLDNDDSREAFASLSTCGQENGCSPGDDECLDNACNSEFITFFSTCLEDGDGGMPYDASCSEFLECVEICSTWECTESCQTTSITDDAINASIDAIQACGAAAACAPSGDDCLDNQCAEELRTFEAACMASDGDTTSDGDTAGGATDNAPETGGSDGGESSESGDEDGCQSAQPSSMLALLALLMVLYFQRREGAQPVKVRRQQERRTRM